MLFCGVWLLNHLSREEAGVLWKKKFRFEPLVGKKKPRQAKSELFLTSFSAIICGFAVTSVDILLAPHPEPVTRATDVQCCLSLVISV